MQSANMFNHIHIQISDTFGSLRVTWPDGTIHAWQMPKGMDVHGVVMAIADEISKLMIFAEPVEAGGLQYENEEALKAFIMHNSAYLTHDGGGWVLRYRDSNVVAYGQTLEEIVINAGIKP